LWGSVSVAAPSGVKVIRNDAQRRVDVVVDGEPFTSYIYPESLKKPVLFPLRTAEGKPVTRGFPLNARPGERVDHPHHVGLWFNYGDVNGVDFWNNSDAAPETAKMGTIRHREIVRAESGKDGGELAVVMDWLLPDGTAVLREDTTFRFRGGPNRRVVDRLTTLTALGQRVSFKDNKEGVLGLRMARALEHPADKPEVFTDASGKATAVPVLDNSGVTGLYRSSEGKTGNDVWGTRGRWVVLTGDLGGSRVGVAIFDHPKNVGYPTFWHARGYGLFAANPLGQKALSDGKVELDFALEPKANTTFRHRILILSGDATPEVVEREYADFAKDVK
jgi:hypothetical protein